MSIERMILSNLVLNEEFGRKTFPFIRQDYFGDHSEKIVFDLITEYVQKYSRFPTSEALAIDLAGKPDLNESTFDDSRDIISKIEADPETDIKWLVDRTEEWCQNQALTNALRQSIEVIDDKDGKTNLTKGSIPKLLTDALAVNFDTAIGHDYFEDAKARFEYYHREEFKVPFDLEMFNKITKGGVSRKTLNIILAGTNVGKSMLMCHFAASNLMDGKNVLYITLEMAQEEISRRIDANLLDTSLDDLNELTWEQYSARMERNRQKTRGKFIVKEYPTAQAGSANFRHLIEELKIKKNFRPDVIFIDYLNICISSRIKHGANVNSYTYVKAIAEELRGLAVEYDVPIWSATQTTRSGYSSSDVGLEDTSESFGLPATADFMFAVTRTEELDNLDQLLVKQLKSRYGNVGTNRRFVLGVDLLKQRLHDVEQSAQDGIISDDRGKSGDDRPVMDRTGFGQEDFMREKLGGSGINGKSVFAAFK